MDRVRPLLASISGLVIALAAAPAWSQSYPLVCSAGPSMKMVVGWSATHNMATVYFAPSDQPASAGVAPGHCAWTDRGFRAGEPSSLMIADVGGFTGVMVGGAFSNMAFTRADVSGLAAITRSGGGTFIFQVHSLGSAVMLVDRVGP